MRKKLTTPSPAPHRSCLLYTSKLGNLIKKGGKKPLLVACDVYRPAAIKQLQVVGGQVGVEVFEKGQGDPVQIAKEAVEYARYYGREDVYKRQPS